MEISRCVGCTGPKRIECDDLYSRLAYALGGEDGDPEAYGRAHAQNDILTLIEIAADQSSYWREVTRLVTELGCGLGMVDRDIRIGRELKLRTWENPLPPEPEQ